MDTNQFLRCEDEPIHIPGLIQPLGYFVSVEYETLKIKSISENFLDICTSLSKQDILQSKITDYFDNILYIIDGFKKEKEDRDIFFDIHSSVLKQTSFDLFISCFEKDEIIFEFIPKISNTEQIKNSNCPYDVIVHKIVSQSHTIEQLFNVVTQNIKELTSYDRVMLYKFDNDYNGEVIAESKIDSLDSYLNLHYPSSDIPAQARALYLKSKIRIISNVNYQPCGIVSLSSKPVDMSLGFLRGVSPIHLEYMKNMGVYASMTISIVIDGRLWGLVACHHTKEYMPDMQTISICEKVSKMVSYLIKIFEQKEHEANKNKFLGTIDTISSVMKQNISLKDTYTFISENLDMFKSLFESDGVVLLNNSDITYSGISLEQNKVRKFVECIYHMDFGLTFFTTALIDYFKGLDKDTLRECSGVVALRISQNPKIMLIWTKPEQVQTINWGGNPNDLASKMTLSPRKSFEKFSQVVTFKSKHWCNTTEHKLKIVYQKLNDIIELSGSEKKIKDQKQLISSLEQEKAKNQSQLIEMLISMIEQRDAYTAGHTQRVAKYSVLLAKELKVDPYDIDLLEQAAKLHDIGKISIPDSLLLKPAKLSHNEYSLIKQHLNVGYEILNKIDYYKDIAEIMRYHHEKYDGSGYPYGKKGVEISLEANIMSVADALDAMTSNRIYQKRKSIDDAVEEIIRYKGVWYHPDVVDALVKIHKKNLIQETQTNQLPLTQMEEERFSYFFKDQLTGFYNDSYLFMILNKQIPNIDANHFLMIELKGMSQYNKIHNWHNGSLLIKNIALYISNIYNGKLIFRVFGDDFILAFEDKELFETIFNTWHEIKIGNVYTSLKPISKDEIIDKMESFW